MQRDLATCADDSQLEFSSLRARLNVGLLSRHQQSLFRPCTVGGPVITAPSKVHVSHEQP